MSLIPGALCSRGLSRSSHATRSNSFTQSWSVTASSSAAAGVPGCARRAEASRAVMAPAAQRAVTVDEDGLEVLGHEHDGGHAEAAVDAQRLGKIGMLVPIHPAQVDLRTRLGDAMKQGALVDAVTAPGSRDHEHRHFTGEAPTMSRWSGVSSARRSMAASSPRGGIRRHVAVVRKSELELCPHAAAVSGMGSTEVDVMDEGSPAPLPVRRSGRGRSVITRRYTRR